MNTYKAYFRAEDIEINAPNSKKAHDDACAYFRPTKHQRHMVHVWLMAVDNKPVEILTQHL